MTIHLNKGHLIALSLLIIIALWLTLGGDDDSGFNNPRPLSQSSGLQQVQVETFKGDEVEQTIIVSAKTAPNRRVELRSEIKTKVKKIHKQKGQLVKKGDLLIELDARNWYARVAQTKANLEQKQLEKDSAEKLVKKGLYNQGQMAMANTAFASAKADYINAKLMLDSTKIRAPFSGLFDQRFVEEGTYIQENALLATILEFSPYLVTGQVAEKDASFIKIGDSAQAKLITGDTVKGKVRFIASEADENTRTFPLEVAIDNPSGIMTAGITAKIEISRGMAFANKISPAILILDQQGQLGIKAINQQHKVVFVPVEIIKAQGNGVWVTGIGEFADIITVGQGFVSVGEQVEPIYKHAPTDDALPNETELPNSGLPEGEMSEEKIGESQVTAPIVSSADAENSNAPGAE